MPITEDEALADINHHIDSIVSYRQEHAERFPDDDRNQGAVTLVEGLRPQVQQLAGTDALTRYMQAHDAVWLQGNDGLYEEWSRYGGRIGFDHFPGDIFEFVNGYVEIASRQFAGLRATSEVQPPRP
ncbi:MAG: hypothetical protein DI629_12380 [Mesorhizobium amorphae]|nr:MAG: hypothetical protein DI629_12380 [Mesorhizobium amorphae]